VARRLAPGGAFVLQGFVPDLDLYAGGQSVRATHLGLDQVRLDLARHDPVAQRVDFQHVVLAEGGVRLHPGAIRYAWPSELDLMARLAGLRAARTLGRLAPGAVRRRQRPARFGLRARRGGRLVA